MESREDQDSVEHVIFSGCGRVTESKDETEEDSQDEWEIEPSDKLEIKGNW